MNNLTDKEFKKSVITILTESRKKFDIITEYCNKEIENIKKAQLDMRISIA